MYVHFSMFKLYYKYNFLSCAFYLTHKKFEQTLRYFALILSSKSIPTPNYWEWQLLAAHNYIPHWNLLLALAKVTPSPRVISWPVTGSYLVQRFGSLLLNWGKLRKAMSAPEIPTAWEDTPITAVWSVCSSAQSFLLQFFFNFLKNF